MVFLACVSSMYQLPYKVSPTISSEKSNKLTAGFQHLNISGSEGKCLRIDASIEELHSKMKLKQYICFMNSSINMNNK